MRIVNARDLGLFVRAERQRLGHSQSELATLAGVSRRWLSDLESGKPTAEVGLALKTLSALGLAVYAEPEEPAPDGFDLDEYLARYANRTTVLGGPEEPQS